MLDHIRCIDALVRVAMCSTVASAYKLTDVERRRETKWAEEKRTEETIMNERGKREENKNEITIRNEMMMNEKTTVQR